MWWNIFWRSIIIFKLEIKPCGLVLEFEIWRLSHNWFSWETFGKQNWHWGINWTLREKCQSVCRDMMFLASNSLHNLGGQKWSCHARNLRQIHCNILFLFDVWFHSHIVRSIVGYHQSKNECNEYINIKMY